MQIIKLCAVVALVAGVAGCQYNDTERAIGGAAAGAVAASVLDTNVIAGAAIGGAAGALCDDAGVCN